MTALLRRALGVPAGGRRAGVVIERNLMVYRRSWSIVLSGFFEPVFYLFAMGVGIGSLVPEITGPGGAVVSYGEFVAPALLAASAMNGAVLESTTNTFVKLSFWRTYDGMIATPLEPLDIAVGEIAYSQFRGLLYAIGFLTVAGVLGVVPSWWGLAAIPAAVLVGFAFAAVGTAAATWIRDWQDNDLVQVVTMPMFLLSATFFPLEVYPSAVQPLVQLSPLYHGTALVRGLMLGVLQWAMAGHVAYLLAMTALGAAIAGRRFERLLKP